MSLSLESIFVVTEEMAADNGAIQTVPGAEGSRFTP